MLNKYSCIAALLFGYSSSLLANVQIDFIESAPKDSFVVKNTSACVLNNFVVDIDLNDTAGQLIFDTTASGAGVEVFQPFEVVEGRINLVSSSSVKDGDKKLSIAVASLAPNKSVRFTIDVDDTLTNSALGNIRVANSEMENGTVNITLDNAARYSGTFNKKSQAVIDFSAC